MQATVNEQRALWLMTARLDGDMAVLRGRFRGSREEVSLEIPANEVPGVAQAISRYVAALEALRECDAADSPEELLRAIGRLGGQDEHERLVEMLETAVWWLEAWLAGRIGAVSACAQVV